MIMIGPNNFANNFPINIIILIGTKKTIGTKTDRAKKIKNNVLKSNMYKNRVKTAPNE